MKEVNSEYIELITKKLTGEASAFEERLLEEWLQESPENRSAYEEFSRVWKGTLTSAADFHPDVNAAWEKVKSETLDLQDTSKVLSIRDYSWYLKAAATILVFISAGIFGYYWITGSNNRIEVVALNEKKEVVLPDSSRVWLNRNSRISYAQNFSKKKREVKLEGEAFFQVMKNAERPFSVETDQTVTTVLGTSFNVRAYRGENTEAVEVVTGRVAFASLRSEKQVLLDPGEKGVLNKDDQVEKQQIKDPNFNAWKSETLVFENTDLAQVASALEDYFHVKVQLEGTQILNCRFTGTFEKPELTEVMDVLSISADITYQVKDSTYILTGKGCN